MNKETKFGSVEYDRTWCTLCESLVEATSGRNKPLWLVQFKELQ